jgi:hypothetical protein
VGGVAIAVGRRVRVFGLDGVEQWFEGRITSAEAAPSGDGASAAAVTATVTIAYDNGEVEEGVGLPDPTVELLQ